MDDVEVPPGLAGANTAPIAHRQRGHVRRVSRMMPDLTGLSDSTWRRTRRKLLIFERACQLRGQAALTEGALALLNSLDGLCWDAMESVNLETFET